MRTQPRFRYHVPPLDARRAHDLVDAGLGHATARDMAHLPVGGPNGSVAQCADLGIERKLLTHINNTNPLLDPRSPERAWIESQGWALAEDGQRFAL